ncbi:MULTISPECIES: cation:proton antiporter [unclassified Leptolyngbya]|uniref:cation:proton antiporter domain-containing protein n=1 Tax=unclassified Leptolyngbya TaxID=2650499 RepID=UPI001687011E|nr:MULTISPECIES: cation:proton antiporter [unclassified Leptolyngbya]MBD1912060.1 cation:proton antiporter [Leptolyngbya sp. FACHB-8]MBD2156568.1 cation:proton antiporter [Leptolyngbya sp. FACHB-16]
METLSFQEPIVTFVLLLAVILILPPIFERMRLPGLVGLLLAGVVLGSSGFNLLSKESETMGLLSDIGKIYLMFVAGLEIDLSQFQRTKNRSLGFGFSTFIFPFIAGTLIGLAFNSGWLASILIGSLLASHTLLAYPIVRRLGVVNNEAVTVTIGATIFTDISALLVLAICVGISKGDFTLTRLLFLLGSLAVYTVATVFGLDRLGKQFFRKSRDDQGNQFLFVLLAVFLASVCAQLIGVEPIVGAFLAGLSVNGVLGDSPVKEKVEFIGSVLFIPMFFVGMGLLLDVGAFFESLSSIGLSLTIVLGLIVSKFIAAFAVKPLYHYNWHQTLTMWSLSMPQVAATLAAAQVGYEHEIIKETVFNSVVLMMLITSILGPLITSRSAPQLVESSNRFTPPTAPSSALEHTLSPETYTAVVPVNNPKNERFLLEIATLLARHEGGRIVPLSIALSQSRMDSPLLDQSIERSKKLLAEANEASRELGIETEPVLRITSDIAAGICEAAREQDASVIVLGMSEYIGIRSRLFGNITDKVLWAAHCRVAIIRLLESPFAMQRVLVPVEDFNTSILRPVRIAQIIASETGAKVTLLHIHDRSFSPTRKNWVREQLATLRSQYFPNDAEVEIKVEDSDRISTGILREASTHDLVVLRSHRRRVGADGLAMSDETTPLLQRIKCSIILVGETHGASATPLW